MAVPIPSSPRSWANSSHQPPAAGSISPRSGSLLSGQHRGRTRDDSNAGPPPQPSNPPSPRPSIPPLPPTPPPAEVPAEELPGIVKRLFAELEDDFEVGYRTQQQVGTGKPQLLRLALEEQIENQLVQVSEQTRLSDSQADVIRRAQRLHLEKLWAVFRATNQTRPQRVLADDADLSALLNELVHPGSIPAEELPPELPYARAGQDGPRSISPNMPRVPNNTESEGSVISGAGVARPSRGSFVMRSNPQATPALRMSGTFSPVNSSPVEAARPVSPRAQKANTGTLIVARRASSASDAPQQSIPPPPSTPPPLAPTSKQESSPPLALPNGVRARPALSNPSPPEVARSRTDMPELAVVYNSQAPPLSLQESFLRAVREIRNDPNPLRAASNNPYVQVALGVFVLLALMSTFRTALPAAPPAVIPPLDPAVEALLDRLNLGNYKPIFASQRLDWTCMTQLRPELLVTIGVPLGHAIRIIDAVSAPLHADERTGDPLVDGASADAQLLQSAAVSLITADTYKTVQKLKSLLRDAGADAKESTRDGDSLVRVSLPPAAFRKALDATLSLSQYNHYRTSVQEVGAELREKKAQLQQVDSEIASVKSLMDEASSVADKLSARSQMRTLTKEKSALKLRLQTLESGVKSSMLVITVRPQDFDASGRPRASFLFTLFHLAFNTPLFFVLGIIGYVLYRRYGPKQQL